MNETLLQALEALEAAAQYLSALDVASLHLNEEQEISYSPLTRRMIEAADALRPLATKPENSGYVVSAVAKYECSACSEQWSSAETPSKCPACAYMPVLGTFHVIDQGEQL